MYRDHISNEIHELGIAIEQHMATTNLIRYLHQTNSYTTEARDALAAVLAVNTGYSTNAISAQLSMESIQDKDKSTLGLMFDRIKQFAQKQLGQAHYDLTLFNMQGSRIRKAERIVSKLDGSDKINVRIGISKYMRYGEQSTVIETAEDYIRQFEMLSDQISVMAKVVKTVADEDLFQSFKAAVAAVGGRLNEYNTDRAQHLHDSVKEVIKSAHLRKAKGTKYQEVYASDVLLGGIQITAGIGMEDKLEPDDMRTVMDTVRNTFMYLHRQDKIRVSTIADSSVNLVFTGKQLKHLCDLIDKLYVQIDTLLSLTTKFSTTLSNSIGAASKLSHRHSEEGDYFNTEGFLRTSRIWNRFNQLVYDSTSSIYNSGMGNIKKALEIIESA